jgi:hypothetical protein
MPESAVGQVVERLNERPEHPALHPSRREQVVEVIEAIVLALVAVATAWSGYQAARWDSHRSRLYAQAASQRVNAEELDTQAGQERLYDMTTFNAWMAARASKNEELTDFLERRFRPEYRVAFQAWLKLDPFHNAQAPSGPIFMPEYHNANHDKARELWRQSSETMENGTTSGEVGDRYVRVTVLLATVLLITAIGQRFHIASVRTGLLIVAFLLLCFPVWMLFTLPRI